MLMFSLKTVFVCNYQLIIGNIGDIPGYYGRIREWIVLLFTISKPHVYERSARTSKCLSLHQSVLGQLNTTSHCTQV